MKHQISIVICAAALGITILGIAVTLHGGQVDIQLGPDTKIKVVGPEKGEVQ